VCDRLRGILYDEFGALSLTSCEPGLWFFRKNYKSIQASVKNIANEYKLKEIRCKWHWLIKPNGLTKYRILKKYNWDSIHGTHEKAGWAILKSKLALADFLTWKNLLNMTTAKS